MSAVSSVPPLQAKQPNTKPPGTVSECAPFALIEMIRSFDVFDTCLTRKTASPSGVFYETAGKVFARLGIRATPALAEDFVAARIEAERIARRRTNREEVTLHEIWSLLTPSMGWQFDGQLASCELEAEEELLSPVSPVRAQLQTARQQGDRIIFISDMYLPAEFIERQLRKHGFAAPGDGLYVSSEIGKTKAGGNLFRHMLAKENVSAEKVRHTGDHPHGDFAAPRRLGIQARLFDSGGMTAVESGLLQTEGDLHAAARVAGSMRAFRLGAHPGEDEAIHELTSQFTGPFTMALAAWVLQRARADGVKRLYFCSRDCQLVWKVARELAPRFGGIECQYLYVSRQSLFLPSAEAISPEAMPWMRREWEEPSLKKLLAKLDLKYESVETAFQELAGDAREARILKSDGDWSRFWQALNTEPVKTRLHERIAARRNLTRHYFESAGLFDDVPWAVVDLGWTLTRQQALGKLLRQGGWPGKIRGYYYGLVRRRVSPVEAGFSEALFYEPASDVPAAAKARALFTRNTLLEHIVGCADHPTVHHHDQLAGGGWGAVFSGSVTESELNFCNQVHSAALEFVKQNPALTDHLRDAAVCRNTIASLISNFFSFPTAPSARALAGLSASMDQNGFNPQPVVAPLDWGGAYRQVFPRRGSGSPPWEYNDNYWLEGSLALTPSKIKRSMAVARRAASQWKKIRRIARLG